MDPRSYVHSLGLLRSLFAYVSFQLALLGPR